MKFYSLIVFFTALSILSSCTKKSELELEFESELGMGDKAHVYAQYRKLMDIKKNVHPDFLKNIEKLEERKEALKLGMSSDRIPFIPGDYEYNFMLMYNLQMKMAKDDARYIAKNLAERFKMKPEQVYEKYCHGQIKYDSIPEVELRYVYCANDYMSESGANCNSRLCFQKYPVSKLDPKYYTFELKTDAPILLLKQSENEECKKNSSFSFEMTNALIRSISDYSNLYGINDFEKCPVQFLVFPSNTKLKVIELITGEYLTSKRSGEEQFVVEDDQKNRYEISKRNYLSFKEPSYADQVSESRKVLESFSKTKGWDTLVSQTYTYCDPFDVMDKLKQRRNLTINYSKLVNPSGYKHGCATVKFNSPLDLQWALLIFDLKEGMKY